MKKTILFIAACLIYSVSFAQTGFKTFVPTQTIYEADWGASTKAFGRELWEGVVVPQLNEQLGTTNTEQIRKNSLARMPAIFTNTTSSMTIKNSDDYRAGLSRLAVYKIATVQVNSVDLAVLCVPYNHNRNWQPGAKWDTAYFFIADSLLQKSQPLHAPRPSAKTRIPVVLNKSPRNTYATIMRSWEDCDVTLKFIAIARQTGSEETRRIGKWLNFRMFLPGMLDVDASTGDTSFNINFINRYNVYQIATLNNFCKLAEPVSIIKISKTDNQHWPADAKIDSTYLLVPASALTAK